LKRASKTVVRGEARRRMFFALCPPERVRDALLERARACHATSEGRVVAHANLHVTLAFLGMLHRGGCETATAVGAALRAHAFELALDRIGYWPENGIVYAAPARTPAALTVLAAELSRHLGSSGLRTEERAYAPHVTLIRAARRPPQTPQAWSTSWTVGDYALMESRHEHGRLVYRPLQCWTLAP